MLKLILLRKVVEFKYCVVGPGSSEFLQEALS